MLRQQYYNNTYIITIHLFKTLSKLNQSIFMTVENITIGIYLLYVRRLLLKRCRSSFYFLKI